jgi:hypothetical protein
VSSLSLSSVALAAPPSSPAAASGAVEKLALKVPTTKLKLFALVYRVAKGVSGQVRLNDMTAVEMKGDGGSGSSNSIQGWIKPGANRIEVQLDKVAGDDDDLVRVSLHGLAEPGFPEDSNELTRVVVKKGATAGTRSYTFEMPATQAPPGEFWAKSAVLTSVSDEDKAALKALAEAFVTATKKGDVAAMQKLFAFAMEERARNTYSDPKEQLGMITGMAPELKKTFGKLGMPAKLEYVLTGGGRIVEVRAAGQRALLVKKDKDGEAAITLRCAKLDGVWTQVP